LIPQGLFRHRVPQAATSREGSKPHGSRVGRLETHHRHKHGRDVSMVAGGRTPFAQALRDRAAEELWAWRARATARVHAPHMMADGDVEAKVNAIIAEQLAVDVAKVTPTASFTEDLGADSLDAVEIIMALEEGFDIEIPDEEAETMTTPGDCVKAIKAKLG